MELLEAGGEVQGDRPCIAAGNGIMQLEMLLHYFVLLSFASR